MAQLGRWGIARGTAYRSAYPLPKLYGRAAPFTACKVCLDRVLIERVQKPVYIKAQAFFPLCAHSFAHTRVSTHNRRLTASIVPHFPLGIKRVEATIHLACLVLV